MHRKGSNYDQAVATTTDPSPVIFWSLVCGSLVLALAYMWCINATVHNLVQRKHLSEESRALAGALAPLESEYLAKSQQITQSLAHELGFVDVEISRYASRDGEKTLLSSR